MVFIDSVNCIAVETMHLVLLRANYLYISYCNNFPFNNWALCCYAYVVIFHLYLTLMFIDEDGFCYFIPLNAFRDYLQQSTSPIFFSFMDLQAHGRNFIRPSFSELVLVGMLSDGSSTLCYAQGRLFICLIHSNYGLFGCLNYVFLNSQD